MQPGNPAKSERSRKVRALFDAAMAEPPERRVAFLRQNCGGDGVLEREVAKLLGAVQSARQGGFLEQPAWKRPPEKPSGAGITEGTQFGPYKVIRPLQAGGMGTVFLTVRSDEVFRKLAALKVIRPECMTEDLVRRFQQERQILAELDHPNIARIIDGGTTPDGLPYFVMDYVEGDHIDAFCSKRRLNLEQRLRLFEQVCKAVQYLHDHRVIHRDLKPSNILVTSAAVVKLVDFGIAKVLHENRDQNAKTVPLMTPAYASPEQIRGEPMSPASDVYALGVVLYELLTGRKPYPVDADGNLPLMMYAVTTQPPPAPSTVAGENPKIAMPETAAQLRRRLAGDLDNILLMALRKEPERRYPVAGDLAADLQRYLTGRPVVARKDAVVYKVGKFVRRQRLAVAASVAIVALSGWGVKERIERNQLEEKVRELQQATRREIAMAEQKRAGLPALPAPGAAPESYNAQIEDLRRVGETYRRSMTEAIRLKPGMTPERRDLVLRAEKYLEQSKAVAGNDPRLRRELASAYVTLGDIRGYPGQPNLNDRDGALAMYREAEGLLRGMPADAATRELLDQAAARAAAVRRGSP
jgi:tRNA A-37 threonylcarbamoyl transferase component Bud32